MQVIEMKPGQRIAPNVNKLSPALLLKIKQDIERNTKGEKKSG